MTDGRPDGLRSAAGPDGVLKHGEEGFSQGTPCRMRKQRPRPEPSTSREEEAETQGQHAGWSHLSQSGPGPSHIHGGRWKDKSVPPGTEVA